MRRDQGSSARSATAILIGSVVLLSLVPTLAPAEASDSRPAAPGTPTVYDDGLHALTVTWTEPDDSDPAITGYDLEYRRRDQTDWLSGPQGQTGTSATITGLEPDKNYYVRVRARNTNGAGDWSAAGEGTTALYVGTLTAGDGASYRGYRRVEREPYGGTNSPGNLVPRSLTYDGSEYRIITLAWCRCTRRGVDNTLHTTAIDLYLFFNAAPDDWVLRVGDMRLLLSDAERADLGRTGLKAFWPHISADWERGGRYEVSLSRNPLLSSSGSGTVRGPLTAEMREVPRTHDGRSVLSFTLSFSEDVANRRNDITGAVLTVTGGSVTDASQVDVRSHREWRITIRPSGAGDVGISVQAERECGTSGAVCTEDGRALSQTVTATVRGPPPALAPGKPTGASITSGDGQLRVRWRAPSSDGGSAITSYDARRIRSDAPDKAAANWTVLGSVWTSGALRTTIPGLVNSVEYDVQIRAVNAVGAGAWSDTARGTPRSSDATLSALELSAGRLAPSFDGGVTSYSASVGYSVTRITVTATANDAGARTSFVRPADADSGRAGHQVALSVGETVVAVRVTAANGDARTYTITVTRTPQDTTLQPVASDPVAPSSSEASYSLVFQGAWTTAVTPDGVPSGAHFTRLIGAVHSDLVSFVRSGASASAGVRLVAEAGLTSTFKGEVQAAIAATTASNVLEAGTTTIGVEASNTLTARFSTAYPRFTLLSMVAPSPDWFVGVSGRPMLNSSGLWLRSWRVNLYPWDAGTEDGTGFSLSNPSSSPQQSISSIRGAGKFSTEPLATLSLDLESVRTVRTVAENTPPGKSIGAPCGAWPLAVR